MNLNEKNNTLYDELGFLVEEEQSETEERPLAKWKILIVDDEKEVHRLTKMVLADCSFDDKA